jgi:hypothetical protein
MHKLTHDSLLQYPSALESSVLHLPSGANMEAAKKVLCVSMLNITLTPQVRAPFPDETAFVNDQ